MGRMITIILITISMSACVSSGETRQSNVDWDQIQGGTKVANIAGIKSLIRPGIY